MVYGNEFVDPGENIDEAEPCDIAGSKTKLVFEKTFGLSHSQFG